MLPPAERSPRRRRPRRAEASQTILVSASDVARVVESRLESGVSFTGELKPQDVTEIMARFDGDLEDVLVREGQRVRPGSPWRCTSRATYKDAWQSAEAELLAARAALVAAQNAERRARKLLEAGAAAPSDLEAAEAGRAAAEAQVQAAEAQSNHTKENADRLDVPAPIAGWVSKVFVHNGDRTAVGDPLFTVVNTDTLELSATIPSEALGRVQAGTPIRFRVDAFPGRSLRREGRPGQSHHRAGNAADPHLHPGPQSRRPAGRRSLR